MDMPNESVRGEKIMAAATTSPRPPFPPFTRESAMEKVRLAEDAWNTRDPAKVALGYTIDSRWRNRSEFINGRNEIIDFLSRKWVRELDYRLIKEMWAFAGNRIAGVLSASVHDAGKDLLVRSGEGEEAPRDGTRSSRDFWRSGTATTPVRRVSGNAFRALTIPGGAMDRGCRGGEAPRREPDSTGAAAGVRGSAEAS
jgi:nuclear transport factor 2 (NTF2) superfamily protein